MHRTVTCHGHQADISFTKTVQVTIGRLRRKLGDPRIIQTIPGVGYRIAPTGRLP